MSKSKLFPITVNDFIPFICFVIGETSEQALIIAEKTFPALKAMGDLELLDPININSGETFVIDPELYIIKENDDIKYWLGDTSSYYVDNTDEMIMARLFDASLPTKESEEKDVKLLPAKISEQIPVERPSDKSTEDSGKDSEEENTEKEDKTVWV